MVTWGNIACKAPWSMITIGPGGELKLCCSTHEHASHISKHDSLFDWFNGEYYNQVRTEFTNKIWPTACKICKQSIEQNHTPSRDFPYFANLPIKNNVTAEIKTPLALEFTPSNLCNQTCAMCGSNFSSKWFAHDKRAVAEGLHWRGNQPGLVNIVDKPYQMSETDFQKILDILPSLETITLKGGEPFVEPRNIQILEFLANSNHKLKHIDITSNVHSVTDYHWTLLKKLKAKGTYINIGASLDGTGKTYEWIRSTPFENTFENMKKGKSILGKDTFFISMTVSLYNFFTICEDVKFWYDKDLVDTVGFNYVYGPYYASPSLFRQKTIDKVLTKCKKELAEFKTTRIQQLYRTKHNPEYLVDLKNVKPWIDFVSEMRGFNILDYQPSLKRWVSKISAN